MIIEPVLGDVDFAPGSVEEEVAQNVRTILATRAGTVPMDRDLGITWEFLDMPIASARARVNNEITRKIQRYEPRARVTKVVYETSNAEAGGLQARVHIEVVQ